MKALTFLFASAAVLAACQSQPTSYKITGTVEEGSKIKDSTLAVITKMTANGPEFIDTAKVEKKQFVFDGKADTTELLSIYFFEEGKSRPAYCRKHGSRQLASESRLPVRNKFIHHHKHKRKQEQRDHHSHADDRGHQSVQDRKPAAQFPLETVSKHLKDQGKDNGDHKYQCIYYRADPGNKKITGFLDLIDGVESICQRLDTLPCRPKSDQRGNRHYSQRFGIHFPDNPPDKSFKAFRAYLHHHINNFFSGKGSIFNRRHKQKHKRDKRKNNKISRLGSIGRHMLFSHIIYKSLYKFYSAF